MKASYLQLAKVLDLEKWQTLQDSLAKATKLAIITVDHKGVPITHHSSPHTFCAHVRGDPDLEKFCHKCDARAGLEAVIINAPYIYLCHCKIVDVAIPITINDKYIGAIMAGQVRLSEDESDTPLEQILTSPATDIFKSKELKLMYEAIPILPYKEIKAIARMLFDLCHYIVGESLNKNLILDMYENLSIFADGTHGSGYSLDSIEQLRKELGNVVTGTYVKTSFEDQRAYKNQTLKPAFDYIQKNKGENVSLKKMAGLCHVSTSHFSRLFSKETGEPFSVFFARHKIEWSKQLLEKTDLSISQISDEFGFSEPGYYIKTFKKFENVTPATYRKYYYSK